MSPGMRARRKFIQFLAASPLFAGAGINELFAAVPTGPGTWSVGPRLKLRQIDVELDGGQLLRRLADAFEKR